MVERLINKITFAKNSKMKHTEESKNKMRLAKLGNKNALGHRKTPEMKEKLREYALGRKHTTETKEKLRHIKLGGKHTPEFKEKMRLAMLGNKNSLGHKHTPEAKEKISQTKRKAKTDVST